MPSSRMQSLVRPSNSLRRTRKELDRKDSFKNDKASQLESSSKEDSRTKIIKSKRQHSLNSLNTKNYRAKANNPPVHNSHGNGTSWFNYQPKSQDKLASTKSTKNSMIFRRNCIGSKYKTKLNFDSQGSASQKRVNKPRISPETQFSR